MAARPVTLPRERYYPVILFLAVAFLLLFLHGNRLVFTNDEGILLEPAQRLAAGARPYIDFFGYMSPGSYWWQAILFRCLGAAYWVGRLPVVLDFSVQCALVYWLVRWLSSVRAAFATAALFFCFQVADPAFLTAQHRWDSATLALGGLCAVLVAAETRRVALGFMSGLLLAASVWCTPSLVLVLAVSVAWLTSSRPRRWLLWPFLGGAALAVVAAGGALMASGSLAAWWQQMLWLQHHYAAVNIMPYGSVIGGYAPLLAGAHGWERALSAVLATCLAMPAWLPLTGVALWTWAGLRKRLEPGESTTLRLLLPVTAALVASAFPRADVMHLAFVAALPYALTGAGLARFGPPKLTAFLAGGALAVGVLFSMNFVTAAGTARPVPSSVGTLHVAPRDEAAVRTLLATVPPGTTLYVHPYMPVHYFITQAKNPTRFSFLAPGMMTVTEEEQALAELQAQPPAWVLYLRLSREEFLRVFPHATGLSERFDRIESWLSVHYRPVTPPVTVGSYQLLQRDTASPLGDRSP